MMLPRLLRSVECHCTSLARSFSSTSALPYQRTKGIPPRRTQFSRKPPSTALPPLAARPPRSEHVILPPRPPAVTPNQLHDETGAPRWKSQRAAVASAIPWDPLASPSRWNPPRKLSREAISLLRLLQKSDPTTFTTPILAERFRISGEAVRRILKSRFELPGDEADRREARRKEERKQEREAAGEVVGARSAWAGDSGAQSAEMTRLAALVRGAARDPRRQ